MRTFGTNFTKEKNRTIGAAPLWILKCPFASTGTIYLSDYTVHVLGSKTKPWIASWGQIAEDINNDRVLTNISTFNLDLIIDPNSPGSDIKTLLETAANNAETIDCELYLWFNSIMPTPAYPTGYTADYVKATSETANFEAPLATDPSQPLTGTSSTNAWASGSGSVTSQRFHIDLGSAKVINRFYYENYHSNGSQATTIMGARHFTLWGSNEASAFAELTYGTDTNWTQLTCSQDVFDKHKPVNVKDPKYISVANTTAYRYYAFKFADNWGSTANMGIRRIVLQNMDQPELIWKGNITDWEQTSDLIIHVEMADRSIKLNKHVGTKLSLADYPDAHLDDVGKMMNIVYGANNMVTGLRADWGAKTTLKTTIDSDDTSVELSDASDFPSSGSVIIDNEIISYTGKSGNTLTTCTRGASTTTATQHGTGSQVWENKSQYDSILAGHKLKTVTAAYAEIDGYRLRVTDGISDLTSGGVHILRASNKVSVSPAENITVSDSGHTHSAFSTVNHLPTSASHYTVPYANITWTGSDASIYDGSDVTYLKAAIDANGGQAYIYINFPTFDGSVSKAYFVITHQSSANSSGSLIYVKVNDSDSLDMSGVKVTQRFYLGTSSPTRVTLHLSSTTNANLNHTCFEAYLLIYGTETSSDVTDIAISGGVVYTRFVERFHALVDGYEDDGDGTFTGTANALIERPDHVVKHFLYTYASWPVADFYTDAATKFGATYLFSVVLKEYKKLKEWLSKFAWESRCYFRIAPTRAELLLRPDSISSDKTITNAMIAMNSDMTSSVRVERSPLDEIINKVSLHYNRDATKDDDEAYRAISTTSEGTSITRYGEKEQPDIFKMDFIQSATMANDVRDFYLARYKDRKKVVTMDLFLDNSELEFADVVTVTPLSSVILEIQKVNVLPGSGKDMRNDKITIIGREY